MMCEFFEGRLDGFVIRWLDVWMDDSLDLWAIVLMRNGFINGWMDECFDGLADVYVIEWMGDWFMDELMDV